MLMKLGIVDLVKATKKMVETQTGIKCYDEPPNDVPSPLFYIEFIGQRPSNTKTMWCETYTLYIHSISEPNVGNVKHYKQMQLLEEALTEDVNLPEQFTLVNQINQGLVVNKTDDSKEKHAVYAFDLVVSYGFKTKTNIGGIK